MPNAFATFNDSVFEILYVKQAEAEGGKANLLATSELDQVVDEKRIEFSGEKWEARSKSFYFAALNFVDALSWKEVLGLCGPEVSLMIPLVKEAYLRLQKNLTRCSSSRSHKGFTGQRRKCIGRNIQRIQPA